MSLFFVRGGWATPSQSTRPQVVRLSIALVALVVSGFAGGPAQAGIIFTDGFEDGKLFGDPASGYGGRLASIVATNPRTGSNALLLDSKEGALYTLPDTYQEGSYTVSMYVRRDSASAAFLSYLTYGTTGGYSNSNPNLGGGFYVEEPQLPLGSYTPISWVAVIGAGDAAIGKNIQLLVEESRLFTVQGQTAVRVDDLSIDFVPANAAAVPEPTSVAILGLGALGMAYRVRRKTRA